MSYATAIDLLRRSDERDLAAVAGAKDKVPVPAPLLRVTIEGGDRSAWTAEQHGAADAALVRIGKALADAGSVIDGYLMARYTLPLASVPPVLTVYCCDLARYDLAGSGADENDRRRQKDAHAFLVLVSQGKLALGAAAPTDTPPADAGGVEISAPPRTFDTNTLAGF